MDYLEEKVLELEKVNVNLEQDMKHLGKKLDAKVEKAREEKDREIDK